MPGCPSRLVLNVSLFVNHNVSGVLTTHIQRWLSLYWPWLRSDNKVTRQSSLHSCFPMCSSRIYATDVYLWYAILCNTWFMFTIHKDVYIGCIYSWEMYAIYMSVCHTSLFLYLAHRLGLNRHCCILDVSNLSFLYILNVRFAYFTKLCSTWSLSVALLSYVFIVYQFFKVYALL